MVSTQSNIQMLYYKVVYLRHILLTSYSNKFNLKRKKQLGKVTYSHSTPNFKYDENFFLINGNQ